MVNAVSGIAGTNPFYGKPRKLLVGLEWTFERLLASIIGSYSGYSIRPGSSSS
jgi:hypothetical protein